MFCDILPNFSDIAGVDKPKAIDGLGITPTLFAKGEMKSADQAAKSRGDYACQHWRAKKRGQAHLFR